MSEYSCALVTGASSGIGAAVVRVLRERGLKVHATARRANRLEALAQETGCIPHALDVLDIERLRAYAASLDGIDVLVNNAGSGAGFDSFLGAEPADLDRVIDVNVRSVTHLTHAILPGMIERGRGHVFNIGSVAGLYPLKAVVYGATKGALHLFSQNLRMNLVGTRVRCTEICPARVRTEFFEHAFRDQAAAKAALDVPIELLEPEDIASALIFALDSPWRMNVTRIEMTPTEQALGGFQMAAAED